MALATCTTEGARALGLPAYGIDVGCFADFVLVAAETVPEAVVQRPGDRLVVRRGRLIATEGCGI
jgi:cytosine/adenosine deaminase-related metal-dependent hydrolase